MPKKKSKQSLIKRPAFDHNLDYASLDCRRHPELYRVGRGEQGVLMVQPYKDEILPLWRFRTPEIARESAAAIHALFRRYQRDGDFVGMDMARKFLQMGYTRARRYANHQGGRKYDKKTGDELPRQVEDPTKAAAAKIFYDVYVEVREDVEYVALKKQHQAKYG